MTRPTLTVDQAMTAIVNAADEHAARVVCAALPPRALRALADLMHVATTGKQDRLVARVLAAARA